jgi:hypothetical protein
MISPRRRIVRAGTGFIGVVVPRGCCQVGFSGVAVKFVGAGWGFVEEPIVGVNVVGCDTVTDILSHLRTLLDSMSIPS